MREWLRVRCLATEDDDVDDIVVLEGGHGDARAWRNDGSVLIIPVVEGDAAKVRFRWAKVDRELSLDFPRGGARTMAFAAPVPRVKQRNEQTSLVYLRDPEVDPLAVPRCEAGWRPGGAMRTCAKGCDPKTPCDKGHCEPWPTGDFCAVP